MSLRPDLSARYIPDDLAVVLVPADAPGLTVTPGSGLIAPHILGELDFDGVVVPEENRLGVPREAFSLMLRTLAVFRVSVAGAAVGLAQAALDEALRHVTTREQFGRPLIHLGAVAQNVALSWTEVEAARALAYRAAALARRFRQNAIVVARVGATARLVPLRQTRAWMNKRRNGSSTAPSACGG